ncbi:hypothetical protein TNCV_3793621 [Trichonephila clavipes]|nr:hypothetical protein TNCV_3793621 [Trichonephila clavipes]
MRDSSVKTTSFHSAIHILLSSHYWRWRRLWFCVMGRLSNGRLIDRPVVNGVECLSELVVQAPTSAAEVAFNGKILPRRIIAMMLDKPLSQKRSRRTRPLLRPHQWCANESEELRANLGHANER